MLFIGIMQLCSDYRLECSHYNFRHIFHQIRALNGSNYPSSTYNMSAYNMTYILIDTSSRHNYRFVWPSVFLLRLATKFLSSVLTYHFLPPLTSLSTYPPSTFSLSSRSLFPLFSTFLILTQYFFIYFSSRNSSFSLFFFHCSCLDNIYTDICRDRNKRPPRYSSSFLETGEYQRWQRR